MPGRKMLRLGVTIFLMASVTAHARHGGGGGGHVHPGGGMNRQSGYGGMPFGVAGGYAGYYGGFVWPYFMGMPGYSYAPYYPSFMMMGSAGFMPQFGMMGPPMPTRGPVLPPPPDEVRDRLRRPTPKPAPASDPKRVAHLVTLGDRLFRAGNLKKAEERYLQARAAAASDAAPHARLAQVAIMRGNYSEAASHLRDAETAEPGWVLTAPDIQSLYGEPAEFARQMARLETYVQAHPEDRNAWLVLGAEWFLSGRTTRAADVFLRLDDPNRKPDVALAAFLIAVNQNPKEDERAADPPAR